MSKANKKWFRCSKNEFLVIKLKSKNRQKNIEKWKIILSLQLLSPRLYRLQSITINHLIVLIESSILKFPFRPSLSESLVSLLFFVDFPISPINELLKPTEPFSITSYTIWLQLITSIVINLKYFWIFLLSKKQYKKNSYNLF